MGSRKLDVVDHILSRLPQGADSMTETSLPSNEDVMFAAHEIQDLGETLRTFRIPDPTEVSTALSRFDNIMVQHSVPFLEMKEDLRRFIFPSMKSYIRGIVLPLLPPTDLVPIYTVALRVHWELEEYLEQEFDAKDKIDDIVTLTGEVACAQALPCGEYMQQTWPRNGAKTLAAVKYTLVHGSSSEYHQTFPIGKPLSRRQICASLVHC